MRTPLEQSHAYAELGMLDEACALTDEHAVAFGESDALDEWRLQLAYKQRDFARAADLGRNLLACGRQTPCVYNYATLALHHIGQTHEALSVLHDLGENRLGAWLHYHAAAYLAALAGRDEAVRHLLASLPSYRNERAKTWLDGDLKLMWAGLARGNFTLATAHLLCEQEFDVLRHWVPSRGTLWELDPRNHLDLPPELQAVVRFDARIEQYCLDYAKAPAGSRLAEQFERWARCEAGRNQERFDRARTIAWDRVLDAQPRYAELAWARGDICAVRNHIMWAAENEPARIMDFLDVPGIDPLVDEMWMMVESDWNFFAKLKTAFDVREFEPQEALETLDDLPRKWQTHPLVEHIRSFCLASADRPQESFAYSLRVCAQWPDDAAPFLYAMNCARNNGWKETAAKIQARAPAAAQRYRIWMRTSAFVNGTAQPELPRIRQFRGQPDLGGMLIIEEKESPRSRTAAQPLAH